MSNLPASLPSSSGASSLPDMLRRIADWCDAHGVTTSDVLTVECYKVPLALHVHAATLERLGLIVTWRRDEDNSADFAHLVYDGMELVACRRVSK